MPLIVRRVCNVALIVMLMALANSIHAQSNYNSEAELKEAALKYFEEKNFEEALPLYSQLLSLYPKDPNYNYRYGAALLMAGSDREKALNYIQFAISKGGVEPLAYFFLGKAFHLNYDFTNAIKFYNRFQNLAASSLIDEYDVDHQIEMCSNGKDLLRQLNGIQVISKQEISNEDFYRIYRLEGMQGKLLAKPDEFMSKYDKKVNEKSIIYFPDNSREVYFSSYGKDGKKGRDIYKVIKTANGSWSEPINLGEKINTPYDENYVFVHPDGKNMYFASNGHNSMGGYDLFKSTYDASTAQWSVPENLDFPFSTVDNDLLYIPNEKQELAYFASDRNTSSKKLTVYKAGTTKIPAQLTVIKGKFIAKDMPQLKKARITVLDVKNQSLGIFETDENGNYEIAINESGGNYRFNVETTTDAPIHSGQVVIPPPDEMEIYSQELHLIGSGDDQSLLIKNNFEDTQLASEKNLLLSPEILKKQANIEVNVAGEGQLEQNNAVEEVETEATELELSQEVAEQNSTPSDNSSKTLVSEEPEHSSANSANEQASEVATDSQSLDLKQEYSLLNEVATENVERVGSDADFAYYLASAKSTAARSKFQEVNKLEQQGDNSSGKIQDLKEEAGILAAQAVFATQLARLLESENKEGKEFLENLNMLQQNSSSDAGTSESSKNTIDSLQAVWEEQQESSVAISKEILQEEAISKKNELQSLQSKNKSLLEKKSGIDKQMQELQTGKTKASKKKLEQLEVELTTLENELEDVDFELEQNSGKIKIMQESIAEIEAEVAFLNDFELVKKSETSESFSLTDSEKEALIEQVKSFRKNGQLTYSSDRIIPLDKNLPNKEVLHAQQQLLEENVGRSKIPTETARNAESGEVARRNEEIFSSNTAANSTEIAAEISSSNEDSFSNFKYENNFAYNLPGADKYITEAENHKKKARELELEYRTSLDKVKNLPSVEERTAKVQTLNELKLKSQAAQLAAAEAYSKANRLEYLRNSASLSTVVEGESSNSQLALMLSDEAELYYSYAKKIRERITEEDRFGKKEVDIQKAYDYEMKALKKQTDAIQLLDKIQSDQTPSEAQISTVNSAIEAKALADEQLDKSEDFKKKAESLELESASTTDEKHKNSLLQEATQLRAKSEASLKAANVLYLKEMELNSSSYVPASSKSSINVLPPMKVANSVAEVDTSSIAMEEDLRRQTSSLPEYETIYKSFSERENLIKEAKVEYSKAAELSAKQQSLKVEESNLRSKANETVDAEEKIKLIKKAGVINQKSSALNASIDSLNHIIKIKNYLIQQKDKNIQQGLSAMDEATAKRVVLLAQVEYLENKSPGMKVEELTVVAKEKEEEAKVQPKEQELIVEREVEKITGTTETAVPAGQAETMGKVNFIPERIESDVFIVRPNNSAAYSNANPIPIQPKMPDGLIYQVQVGAFRNPISQDLFKGFAPLMGEKTASGITRYTAGFFKDFESSDSAKVQIRRLGYKDAFVVAFMNGKRISVSEAKKLSGEADYIPQADNAFGGAGTDKFGNEYVDAVNSSLKSTTTNNNPLPASFASENVENARNANELSGLYYSVQIGVFSKAVKKGVFENYGSLWVDVLDNGLLRYHVGNFSDLGSALALKEKIFSDGIADAFVVAYMNGKRISIAEAKNIEID